MHNEIEEMVFMIILTAFQNVNIGISKLFRIALEKTVVKLGT